MAKNFYDADEMEDDYAFEEQDDPRTWFGGRSISMDCEEESQELDEEYLQHVSEEAEEYFAKLKEEKKKSKSKSEHKPELELGSTESKPKTRRPLARHPVEQYYSHHKNKGNKGKKPLPLLDKKHPWWANY